MWSLDIIQDFAKFSLLSFSCIQYEHDFEAIGVKIKGLLNEQHTICL